MTENRQAIRSKTMLREALTVLLQTKDFQKITIREITEQANLARSTFYAHFETKDDLLYFMIDDVLSQLFHYLENQELTGEPLQKRIQVSTRFFDLWQTQATLFHALDEAHIDLLVIERLKSFFFKHIDLFVSEGKYTTNQASHDFITYAVNYNTYALVGVLRQWIRDGMRYSPEVMGSLLTQYLGPQPIQDRLHEFAQNHVSGAAK